GGVGVVRAARALILVVRVAASPAPRRSHEGRGDDDRGERKNDPEEGLPAALRHGRVDLDIHGVARLAGEAGIRVRREEEVRVQMRREADVGGKEVVQGERRAPFDQGEEPIDDRDEEDADRPDDKPDPERDREDQPEEDREPRALEVVGDDHSDRVAVGIRRLLDWLPRCGGFAGRRLEDHPPALMPEQLTGPGPVAYPLTTVTPAIRNWWGWCRERSGSDAC